MNGSVANSRNLRESRAPPTGASVIDGILRSNLRSDRVGLKRLLIEHSKSYRMAFNWMKFVKNWPNYFQFTVKRFPVALRCQPKLVEIIFLKNQNKLQADSRSFIWTVTTIRKFSENISSRQGKWGPNFSSAAHSSDLFVNYLNFIGLLDNNPFVQHQVPFEYETISSFAIAVESLGRPTAAQVTRIDQLDSSKVKAWRTSATGTAEMFFELKLIELHFDSMKCSRESGGADERMTRDFDSSCLTAISFK
jgi:hypothetical protein